MAPSLLPSNEVSRRSFLRTSAVSALGLATFLAGCGSTSTASSTSTTTNATITGYAWWGFQKTETADIALRQNFHAANPHITVDWSGAPSDQYPSLLRTRLVGGDAPDLFGTFPGTQMYPFVQAGNLLDLTQEPWVNSLLPAATSVSTYKNKIYGLPVGAHSIGVVYDKQAFQKAGITTIPANWSEFLAACAKLKAVGITPLGLANKSQYVTQLIPYAMAPSAIYANTPNFDQLMYEGKVTFANSPWQQMIADYVALGKSGYFQNGVNGSTDDDVARLQAQGKVAMVVQGDWIVSVIQKYSPNADLGMFPLPYAPAGKPVWVPFSVGGLVSISAQTKNAEQAKQFLRYWSQLNVMANYIKSGGQTGGGYSTLKNSPPTAVGAVADMTPYLKVGTHPFLDTNWPTGPQTVLVNDIPGLFDGSVSIQQMLSGMDAAWKKNQSQVTG